MMFIRSRVQAYFFQNHGDHGLAALSSRFVFHKRLKCIHFNSLYCIDNEMNDYCFICCILRSNTHIIKYYAQAAIYFVLLFNSSQSSQFALIN
jgi:hypothetical protein